MNCKFLKNIVSELLLIALLVLGSCSRPCQQQTSETVLQNFYNCSTVDWALIDTLYYRPYNCDWPDEIGAQIHPDFPPEYSARYWHRLQNAKTYLHQQTLPLTMKEYDLLCLLMENRGMAFSREQLLDRVWDYGYDGGTRTVDVHIQTLRAKLRECSGMIETVRGVGYRFGGE